MSRHDFYYLLLQYDPDDERYPRNPCYWFFDQRRMQLGPPVATDTRPDRPTDTTTGAPAASARSSAAGSAAQTSIEEVAASAGVADPAQAATESRLQRGLCFGPRPLRTAGRFDDPDRFAPVLLHAAFPGGSNTCGGPRRDEYAQVLDVFGEPIPGLYGAGEFGEPVGLMYPSNGANISDCLCFGQIAAEHALGKLLVAPAALLDPNENMASEQNIADVIVVGFGPVGAVLAGLLGKRGLRVHVIEQAFEVFPLPRAAHVDHTGLRTWQELGILDQILPQMRPNLGLDFVTADGDLLSRVPGDQASPSGLPSSMYFFQPALDRLVRESVSALPTIEIASGTAVTGLEQHSDHAVVSATTATGSTCSSRGGGSSAAMARPARSVNWSGSCWKTPVSRSPGCR